MRIGSPKISFENFLALLKAKNNFPKYMILLHSEEPALQHDSYEAMGKIIWGRELEISSETCEALPNQTVNFCHLSKDISSSRPRIKKFQRNFGGSKYPPIDLNFFLSLVYILEWEKDLQKKDFYSKVFLNNPNV